jgi:hypothetical protein
MDSLQRTEYQLRFQECRTVRNETHVLCHVVLANGLCVDTSHGGSAVANEDTIPVVVVLANLGGWVRTKASLVTYQPQL